MPNENLPPAEVTRFHELENIIEKGLMGYIEVGNALDEIRDRRLHRETHARFEDYLRHRWQLGKSHAYRLMDAAHVAGVVRSESPIGEPKNEGQARELVGLDNPVRTRVLDRIENGGGWNGHTAKDVARIRREEQAASPDLPSVPRPAVPLFSIRDEYQVPPFTVLDTRQGYWQDRRRQWLALGIRSEVGRDANLTFGKFDQSYLGANTQARYGEGSTSVFDPVLAEIVCRWFCRPGGMVLDPFAGRSVRGIVAACLGHPYTGIELRGIQVEANRQQAADILEDVPHPRWIQGDSDEVLAGMTGEPDADLILSSPPYGDLERYSEDPADLSNMSPEDFDSTYRRILGRAAARLRDNRFAVIVVSNIRDGNGDLRSLVGLTCAAMADNGLRLYNEAILSNACGTAPLRIRGQFDTSRKLVTTHSNVLVFVKGDARRATERIG